MTSSSGSAPTARASDEQALLAQASPAGLALATDRQFAYPPHLELIDREVVDAIGRAQSREDERPEILLVEVPPRHGKSTLISEHTPVWFLGVFPDRKVILTSHGADFAASWGMRARNLLEEHGPELYGITVDPESRSARHWDVKGRKGGMITAGVGGQITGRGAHLLIIDDPIKNAEDALSEVIREKQWDWWLSTARTRLEPGAVVVVLLTRWHQGDLAGRMLTEAENGGDPVREIRLPALAAGESDPLGRKAGKALWPSRFSAGYLEHTRKVIGAYWFAAMYQGSPTLDEGGIFRREDFRYFSIEGDRVRLRLSGEETQEWGIDECRKLTYVDLAASEKQTADYTVATEVWVTPGRQLLVRNVHRDRIPGPDQADFLESHYVGEMKVEEIGYQTTLIQELAGRGLPVGPVYPDKDKVTRAAAAGALYRQHKVFHLAGAEWLGDFELEQLAFPAGEHDDQVDTVAYAARDLPDVTLGQGHRQRERGRTLTGGLRTQEM